MKWLTVKDVTVGQRMANGPYEGATILSIAKNGWCKLQWDDGAKCSVRVHWLTAK